MSRGFAPIPASGARRAGFTLLELLVVVGIIALLLAITFAVGPAVLGNQKAALTRATLASLDRALEEYMLVNGDTPPPFNPADYASEPGTSLFGGVGQTPDVLNETANGSQQIAFGDLEINGNTIAYPRMPDASVFLRQVRGVTGADEIIANLPPSLVVPTPMPSQDTARERDSTPSILDGWGFVGSGWDAADPTTGDLIYPRFNATTIWYVHPENRLAQELFGRCVNRRPYFFSAGPDRLYGITNQLNTNPGTLGERDPNLVPRAEAALADNLYSYEVGPVNTLPRFRADYR